MDPLRHQDHLALDSLSQDERRETTDGTTACTDAKKTLTVSMGEHRAERREEKQKSRRGQLEFQADRIQDQEPMRISSSNALPHFEYLDIAEAVETDVPPELFKFGSLGLSATVPADSKTFKGSEEAHLRGVPLEAIDHSKTPRRQENAYRPFVPQGDLLCIYKTCPIEEMHCEGPYHHNNELGDQDHPYFKGSNPPPFIWRAYERNLQGISSTYEDDMLGGFWAWHVPPFCVVPDSEMTDASSYEHDRMES